MKKNLFFALAFLSFSTAQAVTKTWIGASGSNWSTGTNWSPAGAPTAVDDAIFNLSVSVIIDGTVNINSLSLSGGVGVAFTSTATRSFTISGSTAASSIPAGNTLTVGSASIINFIKSGSSSFTVDGSLIFIGSAASRLDCTGGTTIINGILRYAGGGNTAGATGLTIAAGGTYEIAKNAGTLPAATYDAASLLLISGTTSNGVTWNSTPTYGNIEINSPGQTSAAAMNVNITCNNFTLTDDGTAEIRLSSGATNYILQVNGDFTSSSGTVLNLSNGAGTAPALKVKGAVNIGGMVTELGSGGGLIELNGTTSQAIAVSGSITNAVDLKMNNPAGAILFTTVTLPDDLDLTSGKITLGFNNLLMPKNTPTAIVNYSSASYVVTDAVGVLTRPVGGSVYPFPVGSNNAYLPATIDNSAVVADFSVNVQGIPVACVDPATTVAATWNITSLSTGPCALTLDYGISSFGASYNPAAAKIVHCAGTLPDYSNGSVTGTLASGSGFTSFSPFGISSDAILPLELKSFTGQLQANVNVLSWEILTEKNVKSHIVERSIEGKRWSEIGRVASKGDSQVPTSYSLTDNAPLARAYYRLRSIDFDGKENVSSSIVLTRKGGNFGITSVYPSPTTSNVTVQFNSIEEEKVTVRVMDMTGRLVMQQVTEAVKDINELPITLTGLQAGVYSVTVSNSTGASTPVRFVKQ